MKGTFNAFGRHGVLVEDPQWVITCGDEAFGGSGNIYGDMFDWVVYTAYGIPFGDVASFLEIQSPVVCVETDEICHTWQYLEGKWTKETE